MKADHGSYSITTLNRTKKGELKEKKKEKRERKLNT